MQGQDMGSTVTTPSSLSISSQRLLENPEDPSLLKALGLLMGEGQALPRAAMGAGVSSQSHLLPASPLRNPLRN